MSDSRVLSFGGNGWGGKMDLLYLHSASYRHLHFSSRYLLRS